MRLLKAAPLPDPQNWRRKPVDRRTSGRGRNWRRNDSLTPHEERLCLMVANGFTNAEIARDLGLEIQTVKNEISMIYTKLGFEGRGNRPTLAVYMSLRHRESIPPVTPIIP